ncbi:hypothetical protein LZ023_23290 [Pseudomonas silvicola]|nr:hypothetical protein LZ023_23290 [Pseudomonas silvicola]
MTEQTIVSTGDQQALKDLAQQWVAAYPDLYTIAEQTGAALLARHTPDVIDPHHVYWHRWHNGVSSPRTFTGWEHYGAPIESMTLAELVIHRFNVHDQDNADLLSLFGGLYLEGPGAKLYDEHNEVRVLPRDLLNDFWAIGFASRYLEALAQFWAEQGATYKVLAKVEMIGQALHQCREGQLSQTDCECVLAALVGSTQLPLSLQQLQAPVTPDEAIATVREFDIDGISAKDILRVVTPGGREILYLSGERPAFQVCDGAAEVYAWVRSRCKDAARASFMVHFLPNETHDSEAWSSLHHKIDQVFYHDWERNRDWVNRANQVITDDPFDWLQTSSRLRMEEFANRRLVFNASLTKSLWISYLGVAVTLGSALAPAFWPIALATAGACMAKLSLDIDQAVNSTDAHERTRAIVGAVFDSINLLFNAMAAFPHGKLSDPFETPDTSDWAPPAPPEDVPGTPALAPEAPSIEPPAPFTPSEMEKALHGLEDNVLLETEAQTAPGPYQGVHVGDNGELHIEIDGLPYRVRYDKAMETLLVVNPQNPEAFFGARAVRLNEAGEWEMGGGFQLKGGGPWSRLLKRPARLPTPEVLVRPQLPAVTVELPMDDVVQVGSDYEILLEGKPQLVRYDVDAKAWYFARFDTRLYVWREVPGEWNSGVRHYLDQAAQARLAPERTVTVELPPLPALPEAVQPIPRLIHHVWVGAQLPAEDLLEGVKLTALRSPGYENIIHVDLEDEGLVSALKKALRADKELRPGNLKINNLKGSGFFKRFMASPSADIYTAMRHGPGRNMAGAADVLRYSLLEEYGGIYMDMDDLLDVNLSHIDLSAGHGDVLVNRGVTLEQYDFRGYNNDNFASLPKNPVLKEMINTLRSRFDADPTFYSEPRPVREVDADGVETPASTERFRQYMKQIFKRTGPGLFNDVLKAQRPDYYASFIKNPSPNEITVVSKSYEASRVAAQEFYQPFRQKAKVLIGQAHSWQKG